MKAARTYRRTPRTCTFRKRRDLWLHRCRQHSIQTRNTKHILELFRNSHFESIKTHAGLQEMRKLRTYSPQILRVHFRKNPYCLKNKQANWTKARVYVDSDSVSSLGGMNDPGGAIKVECSSVNLEDVPYLKRIARIGWRGRLTFKWKIFPGATALDHSPQNSSRHTRKAHQTSKLQWSNNLL